MTVFNLTALSSEPEPPRRKRLPPWDEHDSWNGVILPHDGPGIEADIEGLGDGATTLSAAPRNPTPRMPRMPGG